MGPAVAEVALGAGVLPKEISMGLRGLAEQWTDGQFLSEKVMVRSQGRVANAPTPPTPTSTPTAAQLVGLSLSLWAFLLKSPSSLTFASWSHGEERALGQGDRCGKSPELLPQFPSLGAPSPQPCRAMAFPLTS